MTTSVRHLAELFTPAHYTIHLDMSNHRDRTFSGKVSIAGTLQKSAQEIVVHGKALQIQKARIDGKLATVHMGAHDEIIMQTKKNLDAGNHSVELEFSGTITDPMHGIYPSYFTLDGKEKELIATQFESHHAREAFPCIDEPSAKATFDLTLVTERHTTVLGNTPVTSQHVTDDDHLATTFATTPKMSTYLVAFAFGDMEYREAQSANGVTVRAYATPDKAAQTQFAVDFAAKALDFYDEFFGLPYPLQKCDLLALPDFSSGAMENWGLITFRESALLYDEKNSAADTKQYVATVISHELAHQWFGNLVTMSWWDDLWLNESFANWMEYFTVNHFYPEWNMWEQFDTAEQQYAFNRDGLAGVQAVQQHVSDPDEIRTLFDGAIVYAKGACLIRMLYQYLGGDAFRTGLQHYMKRHQYGNTVTTDLWEALGEASGKNVSGFMSAWVHQPGHPVVSFTRTDGTATIRQRRFYAHPTKARDHDPTVWPVPLLSDGVKEELLSVAEAKVSTYHDAPTLLNKGGTGFYHTQYDKKHLHHVASGIARDDVPVADRQRLLIDTLALTKAGLVSTTDLVDLLAHYRHEVNYSVWNAMAGVVSALKLLVNDTPELRPHLKKYVGDLARTEFERLGWDRQKNESYYDELLRPMIIGFMAYSDDPQVAAHLLHMLDKAKKPDDILPELRPIVYTVAVRERGKPAFDTLLGWYHTASADERINLCAGMTSMRTEQLAHEAIALLMTPTIKLQDVMFWVIYLMRNRHARDSTWKWMKDNWDWIKEKYGGDMHYSDFPRYSAAGFSTHEQLKDYKAYFLPKAKEVALHRSIHLGIEDIEVRALWRDRDLKALSAYLTKEFPITQ